MYAAIYTLIVHGKKIFNKPTKFHVSTLHGMANIKASLSPENGVSNLM